MFDFDELSDIEVSRSTKVTPDKSTKTRACSSKIHVTQSPDDSSFLSNDVDSETEMETKKNGSDSEVTNGETENSSTSQNSENDVQSFFGSEDEFSAEVLFWS